MDHPARPKRNLAQRFGSSGGEGLEEVFGGTHGTSVGRRVWRVKPGFDAVLFDAGGVLVVPDPAVLAPTLAYYGASLDHGLHVRAHYAAMAAKSRARVGEDDWSHYNRAYVRCVGVPEADLNAAAEVLSRTRHAHLWRHPVPGAADALQALSRGGVPIGVVSNASGQIEEILVRSGLCQVGDGPHAPVRCIVDSHLVGVAKPDPRIFDHALPHFGGIERSRIIYVGDSVTMDVGGATAAGLTPVLVDPHDDAADLVDCARIGGIADLLSMI